jgi:hypothetical protein
MRERRGDKTGADEKTPPKRLTARTTASVAMAVAAALIAAPRGGLRYHTYGWFAPQSHAAHDEMDRR